MKTFAIAAVLGLGIGLAACSEAERKDAGNDVEAAANKVGAEVKDAVTSPEVKEVGSEIKEAAGDAGRVIKETAKGAADGAREGAAKVEAESKDAAQDVKH